VNTEDLIDAPQRHMSSGLDVYEKEKNFFGNHITKKWGSFIHYFAPSLMC
jgi:hypothetical protein